MANTAATVLAEFASAVDAVAVRRGRAGGARRGHCRGTPSATSIIGLRAVGDVIVKGGDLFGDCQHHGPLANACKRTALPLSRARCMIMFARCLPFKFADLVAQQVKNIEEASSGLCCQGRPGPILRIS